MTLVAGTPPTGGRPGLTPASWALVAVCAILLGTTDDRHVGKISDARQMIVTAVALAETGEIGMARGTIGAVVRPGGDVVMKYGLGTSLAQLPAAFLAPRLEAALGAGTSQPLFLVAPLLFVLLAGAFAGDAARSLGASERGAALAVLLATLASPFGSYGALDLSEALQGACLSAAFAFALRCARQTDVRRLRLSAFAAGAAAGLAVLTKTSLAVVAPLCLLPLLAREGGTVRRPAERVVWAAAGAMPPLAVWLLFEVLRYGGPALSYGDESFSYPFLDGFWRLLVGPNKGLLLFFPAAVLAASEAARLVCGARRTGADAEGGDRAPGALAAAAALLPLVALLGLASAWWSWDGATGWGPRLLVPGIPTAAVLAARALDRFTPRAAWAWVGLSLALNVLPLLQHPTPVDIYLSAVRDVPVEDDVARWYPVNEAVRDEGGRRVLAGKLMIPRVPAASPFLVYPWFLAARAAGEPGEVAARLETPPWLRSRPELAPIDLPFPPEAAGMLAPPIRPSFWGRGFFRSGRDPAAGQAYLDALADQVVRAQQLGRAAAAASLAEKLSALRPDGESAALLVESYRLGGRIEAIARLAASMPLSSKGHPRTLAALALVNRDRGDERNARRYLEAAAPFLPGTPLPSFVGRPLSEWPPDLHSLTAVKVHETRPGLPGLRPGWSGTP